MTERLRARFSRDGISEPVTFAMVEYWCWTSCRVRYDSAVIEPPDTPTTGSTSPAPADSTADRPASWYRDRRDRFRAEAAIRAVQAARLANQRLLLFLGLAIAAIWAYWSEPPLAPILWIVAAALTVWFSIWVRRYRRLERRCRHLSGLADLAEEALLRIARD